MGALLCTDGTVDGGRVSAALTPGLAKPGLRRAPRDPSRGALRAASVRTPRPGDFRRGSSALAVRSVRSRGLAVLAALALAACAATTGPTRYPAEWAALERVTTSNGCPGIDGSYADVASTAFPPEARPVRLSEVFTRMGRGASLLALGHTWPPVPAAQSVSLRLEPEQLHVRFVAEDGTETRLAFRRYHFNWSEKRYDDLFTCYPDAAGARLRFMAEPASHSVTSPVYSEAGGVLVFLLKSADGSLVVQWRSDSLGISAFVVGTGMHFDSIWWRFAPVRTDP